MMKCKCIGCYSHNLDKIRNLENFKPISSDSIITNYKYPNIYICKKCGLIQKRLSSNYFSNIENIYKNYKMFHQEKKKIGQFIFAKDGKAISRSEVIFKFLLSKIKNNIKISNILDYGCGLGINTIHFKKYFKKKKIFYYEKFIREKEIVNKKLLKTIFNDNLFKKNIKFDLVTSIFVLEHITNFEDYFSKINKLLNDEGIFLIQVPDIENNPYDFMIYDHVSHFSKSTILDVLNKYNFKIININNNVIKKEITCIVKKNKINKDKAFFGKYSDSKKIFKKSFEVLHKDLKLVNKLVEKEKKFIILGTSTSAHWIYNHFKNNVYAFADEDANRVGSKIENKKILNMKNKELINYPIFIPLNKKIAKNIEKRYPNLKFYY